MLLKPDLIVQSVHEVTPELLRAHAITAVMVDLDDTLVASKGETLDPRFRAWCITLREAGFPVLILSNGERARVAHWAQSLEVTGLALVGKPFWFAFRRGLALLGSEAQGTVMIGDQLFTDVLGANLSGVMSILVTPLSAGGLPHTRAVRHIERFILSKFALGGDRGSSFHR